MSGDPNLAKHMRMAMWMLTNAIPTVEAGHHGRADRRAWASALDTLSAELRGEPEHVVITGQVHP